MIMMNATDTMVFNFENCTHLQLEQNRIHFVSKRAITLPEEYLKTICAQLFPMLGGMPHVFVLPNFLCNFDHVETITYDSATNAHTAQMRFTNGNMMLMLEADLHAFHALIEEKAKQMQVAHAPKTIINPFDGGNHRMN